jgi:hypothetical protein
MGNNEPDYKDNLYFEPVSVENKPSSVHEENEKLKKQLDKAIEWLTAISTLSCMWDEDVKEQVMMVNRWANEALKEIKEYDGK